MTKTLRLPAALPAILLAAVLLAFSLPAAPAGAIEPRLAAELTCLPVNGYVRLPGIAYDDLTPLARRTFQANPAAVTNALYALPPDEREDFLTLYLEPKAQERHRYFFARCGEVAAAKANAAKVTGADVMPPALIAELRERERVRTALHDGAIPFQLPGGRVFIPFPPGYATGDLAPADPGRADELADSLAVFNKLDENGAADARRITATLKHVRSETADSIATMTGAYRTMIDADWRLAGIYPEGAEPAEAESTEYRWNLAPFQVRDNSFCYGQLEKARDIHGVEQIHYRTTAVVMVAGAFIQVSVVHPSDTGLDVVNEMNADLLSWRDAILAANNN